jgi:phosphate butyryltransferase
MAAVTSLDRMVELVRARSSAVRVVIAACAEANAVLAGLEAHRQGLAEPVFVGDVERMKALPELAGTDFSGFECLHEPDTSAALKLSLDLLQDGRAGFLMKGGVKTDVLLRAVLGRRRGEGLLTTSGSSPSARGATPHRTDAGVNTPDPDAQDRHHQQRRPGGQTPRHGAPQGGGHSATEKVSYNDMVSSKDADILAKLCRMGLFGDAVVGGPFALDIAVSEEKARAKGVEHPVAGRADILCAPNIVTGNVLYKAVTSLMDLPMAGIVVGAAWPLVVPSRGDSDRSKFYALALAAYLAGADA